MNNKLVEKENCPRCGNKFNCSKSGRCWCFEIDVPLLILDRINKEFDSCLCPECLKILAKSGK